VLLRSIVTSLVAISMTAGPAAADSDLNDSDLYTWGNNSAGQLGDGTTTARPAPVRVNTSGALAGKRIQSVSGGGSHSCAIAEGAVYCWGRNNEGQLGRVTGVATEPGPVGGLLAGRTVTTVSAGFQHTCAIADGQLFCWGWNPYGQLGTGAATANSATPIAVMTSGALAGKTMTAVTAGWGATCATDSDGDAYCWGAGSPMSFSEPTLLVDGAGAAVSSLRASEEHACFVQNARAFCGGVNFLGEAGNGAIGSANVGPVSTAGVLNGRSVTTVRLGKRFTCALADAKPFCWGDNGNGQLGVGVVGTPPYSTVPVAVSMPTQVADEPVTALTAGENFTCMIAQGRPFCWGLNTSGQLGDGSFTSKPDPVAVDATGALLGKQARTFSAGFGHMVFLAQQVPTAPREVTASVNGTEATVSWQPPTDDGGRAVMGYRVSGGGSGCESTGSACTVSGLAPGAEITLNVVARNGVGDSVPATVNVTTSPAPAVVKVKQSFSAPKRLKKSGVTVVAVKGARTSAGQPVTTKVKTKGKVKVLRKGGAVKVRSFGKKGWRVTLTQTAPGTDTVEPFSQRVVYVNGKRR
jgi:alpha-tubulin suppressor-like RCC1 family protein